MYDPDALENEGMFEEIETAVHGQMLMPMMAAGQRALANSRVRTDGLSSRSVVTMGSEPGESPRNIPVDARGKVVDSETGAMPNPGSGNFAVTTGELATAEHVVVLVGDKEGQEAPSAKEFEAANQRVLNDMGPASAVASWRRFDNENAAAELAAYTRELRQAAPNADITIIGHDSGAALVTEALQHDAELSSAVLVGDEQHAEALLANARSLAESPVPVYTATVDPAQAYDPDSTFLRDAGTVGRGQALVSGAGGSTGREEPASGTATVLVPANAAAQAAQLSPRQQHAAGVAQSGVSPASAASIGSATTGSSVASKGGVRTDKGQSRNRRGLGE